MAVTDAGGGSLAIGGTGPVTIDDDCVTLIRENGTLLLLVWHAAEVSWDGTNREITFSSAWDPRAKPITIRDGDVILVGGEAMDGDVPVERRLTWVATPHPGCAGEQWLVDSVEKH